MSNEAIDQEIETTEGTTRVTQAETSLGIEANLASALAYAFGFFSGIAIFLLEKDNQTVRWHAAQSIVVFLALGVTAMILNTVFVALFWTSFGAMWAIVSLLLNLVWLGILGVWIYLMLTAYQGKMVRVPVAAGVADGLVD